MPPRRKGTVHVSFRAHKAAVLVGAYADDAQLGQALRAVSLRKLGFEKVQAPPQGLLPVSEETPHPISRGATGGVPVIQVPNDTALFRQDVAEIENAAEVAQERLERELPAPGSEAVPVAVPVAITLGHADFDNLYTRVLQPVEATMHEELWTDVYTGELSRANRTLAQVALMVLPGYIGLQTKLTPAVESIGHAMLFVKRKVGRDRIPYYYY